MVFALVLAAAVQIQPSSVAVQITAHNSQVGCDTIANFEVYNQASHAKAAYGMTNGCRALPGGTRLIPVGDRKTANLAGNNIPVQLYRVEGQFISPDKKEPLVLWLTPSYTEPIKQ
jgi:hypothetical protein